MARKQAESSAEPLVIGVDGGATRSSGLLVRADGTAVADALVGPLNVQQLAEERAASRLGELVESLFAEAGGRRKARAICLGLAGAGRPEDEAAAKRLVKHLDLAEEVIVTSDGRIALEGAFAGASGVVVSAGTGSIAFGKDAQGRVARSGGWGRLLGDEGSAFEVGRRAVVASLRAEDGRGCPTLLGERIKSQLGLERLDQIVRGVYAAKGRPEALAELAPVVFEVARQGDRVAGQIVEDAGRELGWMALSVCRQLELTGHVRLCLVGGLSAYRRQLLPAMRRALQDISKLTIYRPQLSAVQGAALWALRSLGMNAGRATTARLKSTCEGLRKG